MRARKSQKSLGQHFLTTRRVARGIVEAGAVEREDTILEIGPGKGILTHELLAQHASVIAIEKDGALVERLKERFKKEITAGQLSLIEADIRDVDLDSLPLAARRYKIVANIPYYITGELIRLFITTKRQPSSITLLLQKEVAARIARDKKGSVLSMSVRVYGSPRYVKTISRKHFTPAPKVDSAVLVISDISKSHFNNLKESHFFEVLKTGFAKKRKKLLTNLGDRYGTMAVQQAFSTLSLEENVRAEELDIYQWVALAKALSPLNT